jgi:hypothetical protein
MKALLVLCLFLLLGVTVWGRPASFQTTGPRAVPVEPSKDYGSCRKGEKIEHDFLVRNDGNAELLITEVRPSCGCTVASFDKSIAPGKLGKVHVVIDTTAFSGPIAKAVIVLTNDPALPQFQLTLRAKVEQSQEEHHKRSSFKNEYLSLLRKFDIAFEEKYVFDFIE